MQSTFLKEIPADVKKKVMVWLYGASTIVGYLMPNLLLYV